MFEHKRHLDSEQLREEEERERGNHLSDGDECESVVCYVECAQERERK